MRVTSLGSGSSGNALLIEAGPRRRTKVLIDAGLALRTLIDRLQQTGTHPAQLQAVFITHEHSDHTIGLPLLVKRYTIPIIAAPDTLAAIDRYVKASAMEVSMDISMSLTPTYSEPRDMQNVVDPLVEPWSEALVTMPNILLPVGARYLVGDIEVVSFPTSHDAISPCGYLLQAGGCRVCIVTDTGEVTPAMLAAMQHADLLILESNHDRERLLRGPYPYHLKQRILSPTGHLSNDQAAEAVLRTWRVDSIRWLWLAHLSRTNNTPKLALRSMYARLTAANANLAQIHISTLPPGLGCVWDSTQLWHEPSLWEMLK
ncbi:MAG: MBL fold metallo-hydrolase [Ktedonobacteraceae bacterium]